ncbi:MAG: diacylglycerol kinase family protein [Fibrobacterota bacterium]
MIPSNAARMTPGHRYAFLVNPVSGSGKGRSVFDDLPKILEELGLSPDQWTRQVTEHGRVVEQARELFGSSDRLIVAGGDGTIGQAMEGLRIADNPQAALGVIPLGTGNDLARELNLLRVFAHLGLKPLVESLLQDRVSPLDLWRVGESAVMANYLSFGADGWVTETFGSRRDLSGSPHSVAGNKLRFARAGMQCLARRLPSDFRIRMTLSDGSVVDRGFGGYRSVLVLNICSYAGGMLRPNRTRSDDGLLTVMAIPRLWHYGALALSGPVRPIHQLIQRRLPVWQVRSLDATWTGSNALQVDGEGRADLLASNRLEIAHHGRVRLLSGEIRK